MTLPYYLPKKNQPNAGYVPRRFRRAERHRDLNVRWYSKGRWRGPASRSWRA